MIKLVNKKIFSLLLIAVLLISFSTSALASEVGSLDKVKNYNIDEIQSDDSIIVEDSYGDFIGNMSYSEYRTYLYGPNVIVPYSVPGVVEKELLSFSRYQQSGRSWSSHQLLNGTNTIGTHGCALTSTTMVLDYFEYNDNPKQVNNKLLPYQPDNDGNMYWGNVPLAYNVSLVKSSSVSYSTVDDAYDDVRGQIRLNRPVIIGVKKGNRTHFVAARGILETKDDSEIGSVAKKYIYIHDPASRNYTQLEDYINDGYYVYRIISYKTLNEQM
ncbi:C39 family peptidase [Brassicibacter mesophilus]|uniref:C39 family peptidase n=1 Tax=Brassicibacter mesophilus TaxID=745119 RepID=UPI003D1EC83C